MKLRIEDIQVISSSVTKWLENERKNNIESHDNGWMVLTYIFTKENFIANGDNWILDHEEIFIGKENNKVMLDTSTCLDYKDAINQMIELIKQGIKDKSWKK